MSSPLLPQRRVTESLDVLAEVANQRAGDTLQAQPDSAVQSTSGVEGTAIAREADGNALVSLNPRKRKVRNRSLLVPRAECKWQRRAHSQMGGVPAGGLYRAGPAPAQDRKRREALQKHPPALPSHEAVPSISTASARHPGAPGAGRARATVRPLIVVLSPKLLVAA